MRKVMDSVLGDAWRRVLDRRDAVLSRADKLRRGKGPNAEWRAAALEMRAVGLCDAALILAEARLREVRKGAKK